MSKEHEDYPLNDAEQVFSTACDLCDGSDSSSSDQTKALELWLQAANELNYAPPANRAARVLNDPTRKNLERSIPQEAGRAKELFETAIDADDAQAMFNLAELFYDGAEGAAQDAVRTKELYERAAGAVDVNALHSFAYFLGNGDEQVIKDAVHDKELYERAVDAGDVNAMNNLAILLCGSVEGVTQDAVRAKELYERAAGAGVTAAMYNLGNLLLYGAEGVTQDAVRAKELYERAAAAGDVNGVYNLAILLRDGAEGVPRDAVAAKELYERAVNANHVNAMYNLANLLEDGAEGVVRDTVRAKELYERAVDAGHADAMYNLAILLRDGAEGVPRDAVAAKELYERAVDAGHVNAICNLAALLHDGAEGVAQDAIRAKELLERVVDMGDADVMYSLAKLLHIGPGGVRQDAIRAKELYERAVDAGHVDAMYNLAILLRDGAEGVPRDAVAAKELYKRAADTGDVQAIAVLSTYSSITSTITPNANGSRDVFVAKPSTEKDGDEQNEKIRYVSRGIVVPTYDENAMEVHTNGEKQSAVFRLILCARRFTVGDQKTLRDATKAARCFEEAIELARNREEKALALTEYARFLLDLDEKAASTTKRRESQQQAIKCLEESLCLYPFSSTRDELINLYTYCPVMELRNARRANELKRMTLMYRNSYFKEAMTGQFITDHRSDRLLVSLLRDAVVKPRSCLLMILGAPGRGKTTTLNSLRGLPFFSDYKSTELAEISQFVMEPDLRCFDDGMLRDLDIRENSFRAIASRLQREDVIECENNVMAHTSRVDVFAENHRDVLEILRGALIRSEIGGKDSEFVRCWDMGGQNEYEMAHSLFIARADILLFAVNLKRVCNTETREEEMKKLCYWMQLAHMMVRDPSRVRVMIVGTHKSEVECEEDPMSLLVRKVRVGVSESVDESWVRDTSEKHGCVFVAIENRTAIDDTVGSGLEDISVELKRYTKDVLREREEIPLKWLALIDKMRRIQGDKKVLWTRKEVEEMCEGFPGFPAEASLRNEELIKGLRKMTTLTGIASTIVFELGNSEWVVSVSPERILKMFRSIISRSSWERSVGKKALERLDKSGTLYEKTLMSEIWGRNYEEMEKRVMIKLLCECDLLIRLRDSDGVEREEEDLYGVPYLLPSPNVLSKKKGENERTIVIVTKFDDSLPRGLQGGLMANLSRRIHLGLQRVDMVGRSSARLVLKEERVIVEYKGDEREIVWTGLGRNPLDMVERCLKQMDEFLRHGAHPVHVRRRSMFKHKHCSGPDDVEVDYSALRRPDHEVRCKVCMAPALLSKFWEGVPRSESSDHEREAGEENLEFRFVYDDVLQETIARRDAVVSYFGREAMDEACKGLSRRLELNDEEEVEKFGNQLRNGLREASERQYTTCWEETSFCFAISYTQHDTREGRFKFSEEQWRNLKAVLKEIRRRGVSSCRIWLDQCLWLRDLHQGSWAVCGLFPYLLWPVISLGDRRWNSDRTTATYERMWPFVEEVLGLWSLGVITTSVERGARKEDGCRKWMIRNHRRRLHPEKSMRLLLLNIYHGGAEGLKTGWSEDVKELQAIAKWNVEIGTDKLVVRSDWRELIACREVSKPFVSILKEMALLRGERGEFLDASKRIERKEEWSGLIEWMSGNRRQVNESKEQRESFVSELTKINVKTDIGKFVLLGFESDEDRAVWLLVALSKDSESFSLNNMCWTTVVHGESSRQLRRNIESEVLGWVLEEQLGKMIRGVLVVP